MITNFSTIISWVLALTSCIILFLMGNKSIYAPILGILNQVIWFVYIIATKQWAFAVGATLYLIVHIRNLIKWSKERKNKNE